ncbi:MarR family transcriptional regulator, partial [Streptomyces sp. SID7803]|nr:MarR family transcriptional regulator [Streptomyces sp. SID7803]
MSTKKESDSPGDWLTLDEERDWRAYLRMVTAVQVRTAHDLATLGLSEPDYE